MVQSIAATPEQLNTYGLSLEDMKHLRKGAILNCLDMFHAAHVITNADGTPARLKVTSVKTWKRTPDRVEVRVQRGLYEHYTFEADDRHRLKIERA
jgi:hypothetical protein